MDDDLIQFLNNFPLGTTIAVVIGLCTLAGLCFGAYKKIKASIKKQVETEHENSSYKETISNLQTSINNLESKIENYVSANEEERNEIHEKLDNMWNAIHAEHAQSTAADTMLKNYIKNNETAVEDINRKMDVINKKTNLLIESDKEGIKTTITDKYYIAMREQYIEIHVLQALEALYEKYLEEHGNTFISGLMKDLRNLPHTPPVK